MQSPYVIKNTDQLASPSLLVFPEVVQANIAKILTKVKLDKLRPHIKTIKSKPLIQLLIDAGVRKFKCATLKEASLLLEWEELDILLAYPVVGYQLDQFIQLLVKHPQAKLQCLIDDVATASLLHERAAQYGLSVSVFIDVNLGMGRTGVAIDQLEEFYEEVKAFDHLEIIGFHGYDGHIREIDLGERTKVVKAVFDRFLAVLKRIEEQAHRKLTCVFGGSNTFPIYSQYPFVECSPGTFMLWDWGYHISLPEQNFGFAAVLFTRIISKPSLNHVCLDLGYKAVASENPIAQRFHIPKHENWRPIMQSEEHLVLEVPAAEWENLAVGTEVYVIPYHICPTVAMYPFYRVVAEEDIRSTWEIAARY